MGCTGNSATNGDEDNDSRDEDDLNESRRKKNGLNSSDLSLKKEKSGNLDSDEDDEKEKNQSNIDTEERNVDPSNKKYDMKKSDYCGVTLLRNVGDYFPDDIEEETVQELVLNALDENIVDSQEDVEPGKTLTREQALAVARIVYKEVMSQKKKEDSLFRTKKSIINTNTNYEEDEKKRQEEEKEKEEQKEVQKEEQKEDKKDNKVASSKDKNDKKGVLKENKKGKDSKGKDKGKEDSKAAKTGKEALKSDNKNKKENINKKVTIKDPKEIEKEKEKEKEMEKINSIEKGIEEGKSDGLMKEYSILKGVKVKIGVTELTKEVVKNMLFPDQKVDDLTLEVTRKKLAKTRGTKALMIELVP